MTQARDRARQLARTLKQPSTIFAPFVSLAARAIKRNMWVESVDDRDSDGPDVAMHDVDEVQPPEDGAGSLNQRRYRVSIANSVSSAEELLEAFRLDPNEFSPTSYACFTPVPKAGLGVGDEVTVELPGPWDGPVTVTKATKDRIRLETRVGHMEAGWIEFRTSESGDRILFEIESLARSGDSIFDVLYHRGRIGKLIQTEMWVRVLEAGVRVSHGKQVGQVFVDTVVFEGTDS